MRVICDREIIGIITGTDLFKAFLELFGVRTPGIRLVMRVPNIPGEIAKLTQAIFAAGGNIVALGTILNESNENGEVMAKVAGLNHVEIRKAVEPYVERIVDIRESVPI